MFAKDVSKYGVGSADFNIDLTDEYVHVAYCQTIRDTSLLELEHGVDPLSYFSFQPVLHDWCNKDRGMCYPVCWMVHIKEPLLLIGKSSLCGGSGFPFSLSEWSLTICLTPYNRKQNVLSASLNKTFPSFLLELVSNGLIINVKS